MSGWLSHKHAVGEHIQRFGVDPSPGPLHTFPRSGVAQLFAVLPCGLVTFSSSTIASYFGLFMKLSTETC